VCPRDTINNRSTAREFEDGKQIFAAFIFAAFNGGLKPAAQGWVSHKQNYVARFAGSVVFLYCIPTACAVGWKNSPASLAEHSEST